MMSRTFAAELRVGLVAGLVVLGGLLLKDRLAAESGVTRVAAPMLGDPIADARAALARGDAVYVVVANDRRQIVPGVSARGLSAGSLDQYRMYSQQSTGLTAHQWQQFETELMAYAGAYNAVVHEVLSQGQARS